MRITNEFGNTNNVTVSGNYLIGAGVQLSKSSKHEQRTYTISNISVTNNYIGFQCVWPYYPAPTTLATVTGNTTVDFTNPAASTQALAAYVAAGVPTANVVSGRPAAGPAPAGRPRRRSLGNGYVGGATGWRARAKRTLSAAPAHNFCSAARARTFSPISPSATAATRMSRIRSGKGRDRSQPHRRRHHHARRPEFHLHRLRPIRRRRRGALSTESRRPTPPPSRPRWRATRTADFSITLAGLMPLTAANFALTAAQSSAASRMARP